MKKPSKKINLVRDALHGMAYYIFLKSLRSLEEFRRNPHVKILPKSPSTNFQSLGKFKNPIFNSELFSNPAAAHLLTPCPAQSAHRLLCLSDSAIACSACPIRPTPAPLLRFGRCLPLAHRWAHPVSEPGVVTFIGQCPSRHYPSRRCHTARRRPSPSHTWKELNRSAESPPSVSLLNQHCPVASRSPPRNGQPPLTPPPTEAHRPTALLPLTPYKKHHHLVQSLLHRIPTQFYSSMPHLPCHRSSFRHRISVSSSAKSQAPHHHPTSR
jgi:hypothetical protein